MKFISNTKMQITRLVEERVDEEGVKHRRVSKELLEKPLELGSLMKPKNKDIIDIKINVPRNNNLGGFINFFGN